MSHIEALSTLPPKAARKLYKAESVLKAAFHDMLPVVAWDWGYVCCLLGLYGLFLFSFHPPLLSFFPLTQIAVWLATLMSEPKSEIWATYYASLYWRLVCCTRAKTK